MINRVQLMEGGDWTQQDLPIKLNIQTADKRSLMRKLRRYAILFDEVVFAAGDYVQSDSLYEAAKDDKPLWGKDGPIRLAMAKAIGDISTYRSRKFGKHRPGIWRGAPCDRQQIIEDAHIDEKVNLVADVCRTRAVFFDEGRLTGDLREHVIWSARESGLKKLADEMERDEGADLFNRDTIIGTMRELQDIHPPQALSDFLRYVNVCYYFNGASALGAELGVHASERGMDEVVARADLTGSTADLKQFQHLCPEWIDHYAAVKSLVAEALDVLKVDRVLSLPAEPFQELIRSSNAAAFRQKLRDALPPQVGSQACALREVPVLLDSVNDFRDNVRAVLDREKKWMEPVRTVDKVTRIATHGLAAVAPVGALIGVIVCDPWWLKAVSAAGGAVGNKWVAEPLRRLAVMALRNRTCPLLTFAESAAKAIDSHIPA